LLKPTPVSQSRRANEIPPSAPSLAVESTSNNPWRARLAPYRSADPVKSIWQLVNTLTLLFVTWGTAFYLVHNRSFWAVLPIIGASGMLVRLFVLQHDCGHRSFFKSVKANDRVGAWLGILTLTPYHSWRRLHAVHHATSGDLDRRGRGGEILLLTVDEYRSRSIWGRLGYRLYRNTLVLFVLGPFYQFVIKQRFANDLPKTWERERRSVYLTNVGWFGMLGLLTWALGWQTVLLTYLPVATLASAAGVWLFYVQHQYEEAYFHHRDKWDYVDAALRGSSHFRLPKVLQWMTASIGIHHVHHLDSRIPNYRLQRCVDEQPGLAAAEQMTFWDGMRVMNLKIWDEKSGRLLSWREYDKMTAQDHKTSV